MAIREAMWYRKVADIIVREAISIQQAASMEGLQLDGEELQKIYKSRSFQYHLWQARFEYYNEISSNPQRGKAAMLGLMTLAVQNLAAQGEWKEVLEGVLKLSKVEGWVGGDSNVNVFANLTAKDIEEARERIAKLADKRDAPEGASKTLPN